MRKNTIHWINNSITLLPFISGFKKDMKFKRKNPIQMTIYFIIIIIIIIIPYNNV